VALLVMRELVRFALKLPQKNFVIEVGVAPFRNMYLCMREQKLWSWLSNRLNSGMTVLANTISNLTDRPTSESVQPGSYQLKPAGRVWVWIEMVASLRGREPGSRGTYAVENRYCIFAW
jgi:hypothetical protein